MDYCESRGIGLSLPSLRADNFSMDIMQRVQKVRKSGLTFAPEAGTQRLRDVINKNVTEEDLLRSCAVAFQGGWNSVKLYFMLGLPTETDEDVLGIAELADRVVHCWRENSPNRSPWLRLGEFSRQQCTTRSASSAMPSTSSSVSVGRPSMK